MIFGASAVLLLSRLEGRKDAADIYLRRTFWLMLFGIVHAFLLWEGEILYPYSVCGLLLYPFRNMRARRLLAIGVILLMAEIGFSIDGGFKQRHMVEKGKAAVQAAAEGKKLTDDQQDEKTEYELYLKHYHPDAAQIEKVNSRWRGNPWEVIKIRAEEVYPYHAIPYYHWYNFDIWSMMFIGMALLKMEVLSGERSYRFYGACVLIGYGIGIPLNSYTAWVIIRSGFDPAVQWWSYSGYDVGRLTVALGHLGVIIVLLKGGWLKWLMNALGAIGQTALSNYVFQSVVSAFLFTGYGFALFGKLQRHQLYYVVAAIWLVQLAISPIWVRHFRFGPMEWCWRSLTVLEKAADAQRRDAR